MASKTQDKKEGAHNFVSSMLESAQENRPVQPQIRFDHVDQEELERTMANLKKGVVRR